MAYVLCFVEMLNADGRIIGTTCELFIPSVVTEHSFNHTSYRWSAEIKCEENGQYGCEEGYYGKEKESDPWQRIG